MIRVVPKPGLNARQIAELRKVSTLGIAEIQTAARLQTSVRDVAIFGNTWEEERAFLCALWRSYALGNAPFDVSEQGPYGPVEHLSPIQLEARLRQCREIELEQQMQSDVECGFIGSRDEFVPHDEEWFLPDSGS